MTYTCYGVTYYYILLIFSLLICNVYFSSVNWGDEIEKLCVHYFAHPLINVGLTAVIKTR